MEGTVECLSKATQVRDIVIRPALCIQGNKSACMHRRVAGRRLLVGYCIVQLAWLAVCWYALLSVLEFIEHGSEPGTPHTSCLSQITVRFVIKGVVLTTRTTRLATPSWAGKLLRAPDIDYTFGTCSPCSVHPLLEKAPVFPSRGHLSHLSKREWTFDRNCWRRP